MDGITIQMSMPGSCSHCSTTLSRVILSGPCPRVKAIEYHPNGTVKRVEFHDPEQPITKVFC